MLRITTQRAEDDELVMTLEGCLYGPWVPELADSWRQALARSPVDRIRVDLADVCHMDAAGREVIAEMLRAGARLVARGCVMPELLRELADGMAASRRN